jgi:hypothetical protein
MIKPDFITEYVVWVGGSEMGHYSNENEAEEVVSEWKQDGYGDATFEEIEVDAETPMEADTWLRSAGF